MSPIEELRIEGMVASAVTDGSGDRLMEIAHHPAPLLRICRIDGLHDGRAGAAGTADGVGEDH